MVAGMVAMVVAVVLVMGLAGVAVAPIHEWGKAPWAAAAAAVVVVEVWLWPASWCSGYGSGCGVLVLDIGLVVDPGFVLGRLGVSVVAAGAGCCWWWRWRWCWWLASWVIG